MNYIRRIAAALLGVVCVSSTAAAGTVSGKIVGWSTTQANSSRHAVVWLEGGAIDPVAAPNPVMSQRGGKFVPTFLIVVMGQTVDMPNQDEVAHNVYSLSPTQTFNLGFYAKGQQKHEKFDRAGLVEVGCSIHTFMRAKIFVVPNDFYSNVGADGSFHIKGVPAGSWTLKFWGEGMLPYSQEINVPATGGPELDLHVAAMTNEASDK